MNVGVLGSGDVGKRLAGGFAARGHDVVVGTRSPGKAELGAWAAGVKGKVRLGSFSDAAKHGELLVLAVHGENALEAIEAAGQDAFSRKVVIDVTNPLTFSNGVVGLFVGTTDSLSERVQKALPTAKVVKAFNTVGSPQMVDPRVPGPSRLELLIAGNDATAKQQVTDVVKSFGWSGTIDVGDLAAARWLEAMVPLWVRVGGTLHTWAHVWAVARE